LDIDSFGAVPKRIPGVDRCAVILSKGPPKALFDFKLKNMAKTWQRPGLCQV
jgi:hypothetical protein